MEYRENSENVDEQSSVYVGAEVSEAAKKKKKGKKIISWVLILVLVAAAGFSGALAAVYFAPYILPANIIEKNININPNDTMNVAEAVAEKVMPSVVGINIKKVETYENFFGMVEQRQASGAGTGLIVSEDGYILTNSHVVGDGSNSEIVVQLVDGKEVKGNVLWNDTFLDLAVVKINEKNLVAAELGDSAKMKVGSYSVAIGNPLGLAYDRSVTQGVISGLERTIQVSSEENGNALTMDGLIQTDASINAGNSGGPLCNSKGEVIGINTAKAQGSEGLGFAIPINIAKPIVEEIIAKGEFERAYLGITGINLADLVAAYPNEKFDAKKGVYVKQIFTDSAAAKAGMKEGDIIVELEGKEVESYSKMIKDLFAHRPGDKVDVTVIREGNKEKLSVTLQNQPK